MVPLVTPTAYLYPLKRNDTDPGIDPDTLNAWAGFEALDYTTVWNERTPVLTAETPVVGFIQTIHGALRGMGLRAPAPIDYPEALTPFLGRKVWRTTMGEVLRATAPVFVKPCAAKAFTGFVWTGSEADHWTVMHMLDGEGDGDPVWCSEVTPFLSEWRVFVHRGEVVGIRGYKGEPLRFPDPPTIRAMVARWADAPVAYALDVGIIDGGITRMVEVNDCYALGSYDLPSRVYAQMLADRWREIVTVAERPTKSARGAMEHE